VKDRQTLPSGPTTPTPQRLPALTRCRFGLFRFRSPLLTESLLFSLPAGTEMFHFPAFPLSALCVQAEMAGIACSGFPIRKSSDQSLVDNSPRLFAVSNVLLRLLVPRHPPYALSSLLNTKDARVHCAVLKVRVVPIHTRRVRLGRRRSTKDRPDCREESFHSLRAQQRAWASSSTDRRSTLQAGVLVVVELLNAY
jgi:hypothetical protein